MPLIYQSIYDAKWVESQRILVLFDFPLGMAKYFRKQSRQWATSGLETRKTVC